MTLVDLPTTKPDEQVSNYNTEDVLAVIRGRLGWLIFFFFGLFIAAMVVGQFEELLRRQVELSYFVPLLIGHGGNSGSQACTTVIRALALKHVTPTNVVSVMFKEAAAGMTMGCILGSAIFGASFIISGLNPLVALTVAVTLPIISIWSNVLGVLLPMGAVHFGLNPATTAAPLMTTLVDATGLLIYFAIAQWLVTT